MKTLRDSARTFLLADRGAVAVDWTVLSAAIVGMGLASVAAVRSGVVSLGGDIDQSLAGSVVASLAEDLAYAPLILTVEELDAMIANQQVYDDATLLGMYGQLVWQSNSMIEGGSPENARIFIDMLYAVDQNLSARSLAIPAGEPSFADVLDSYRAVAA